MSDFDLALRTGNWLRRNQVQEVQGVNPCGMDVGRFPININIDTRKVVEGFYSTNWFTGMSIFGLTMLHDLNNDPAWISCAELAVNYLRCLQLTMDPDPAVRGAICEYALYYKSSNTRDSLSGAWGMLRLYRSTQNPEFLARVEMFAAWYLQNVMRGDYPLWNHELNTGRENYLVQGCFQGGCALFFRDLYELTGRDEYRDTAARISNYFMEHFWDDERGLLITYDPATGYTGDSPNPGNHDWNEMHKFNDDFSSTGLMLHYAETGDRKYLAWVERYMDWMLTRQNDDGSFGQLRLEESSCVAALNLLNAWLLTGKSTYLDAARSARKHLLKNYMDRTDCAELDGGVLGLHHCVIAPKHNMVSLRVTNYTIYTMVLFGIIEAMREPGYTVPEKIARNPMFPGLRKKIV